MALQDLTPQLRTRLSRLEHAVGWFVLLAALLLAAGFAYYLWHTAQRKGWFQEKVLFSTYVDTATGIKPGDPVKLMGFPVGEVTKVVPNEPDYEWGNVTVFFVVRRGAINYCGYLWSDSRVKVTAADFLGNRALELVKGRTGIPLLQIAERGRGKITGRLDERALTNLHVLTLEALSGVTNQAFWNQTKRALPAMRQDRSLLAEINALADPIKKEYAKDTNWLSFATDPWHSNTFWTAYQEETIKLLQKLHQTAQAPRFYTDYQRGKDIFIVQDESPALTERLERVVSQAEKALPNILSLTNQLARVLDNAARLTENLDATVTGVRPAITNAVVLTTNATVLVARVEEAVADLRPALSNLTAITARLKEPQGSLGEWLIPTNLNRELETVLTNAGAVLLTANATLANADTNLTSLVVNLNRSLDSLAGITSNLNAQVQANTNILSHISDLVRDTDAFVQGLRRHWLLRSAFKTNAPPPAAAPPANAPAGPPRKW